MSSLEAMDDALLHDGPPTPPPPSARESVGKVLTVLASVLGPPAAAFAGFVGLITWSDCFLECGGQPDHLEGGLLVALALGLLLAGPLLAAVLVRKAAWVLGAVAAPFAEAALLVLRHWVP